MTRIVDLEVVDLAITDGMRIGLGGFWFVRNPTALIDRVIDSGAKDLEIVFFGGGLAIERLIASGSVRRLLFCFHSMDVFGLAPNFRAAAERGSVEMVEVTTQVLSKALEAAHENIPSLPVIGPLGSDFLTSGYPLFPYTCPASGRELYAVPALHLDLALIHAQRADPAGNVCISGGLGLDRQIATAAARTVISVEEVVEDFSAERAHLTTFSSFLVDDVVVAPGAAYPGSCLPYYATDYVAIDEVLDGSAIPAHDPTRPEVREAGLAVSREIARRGLQVDLVRTLAADAGPGLASPPTPDETMVATLASLLKDEAIYTVGSVTPLSMAAYQLAKRTHAPDMVLIPFAGLVDVDPYPAGIQTAEPFAFRSAHDFYGIDDLHFWIYQRGAIDGEIFTPGQIDGDGNINNTRIGRGPLPSVRLPGQAGIADVTILHTNLYMYAARHDTRRFVELVDFLGGARSLVTDDERRAVNLNPGRVLIVTNLCVFELDKATRRLEVASLHAGVSMADVAASTGFRFDESRTPPVTPPPTAEQIRLIREVVDPWGLRLLEFVPNRDRRPMIRRILDSEYRMLGLPTRVRAATVAVEP